MGCDYYIQKYLEIQHSKGISYYVFDVIRGYYLETECEDYDSDEDYNDCYYNSKKYKLFYENMIKMCLTPRKPIVIYDNNLFTREKFEVKYLPIVKEIINKKYNNKYPRYKDTGTLTNMEQIIKITKKEDRYKR